MQARDTKNLLRRVVACKHDDFLSRAGMRISYQTHGSRVGRLWSGQGVIFRLTCCDSTWLEGFQRVLLDASFSHPCHCPLNSHNIVDYLCYRWPSYLDFRLQ